MRASIAALLSALSLWGGCSFTFDDNAPELPLIGGPPNMSSFPRLNHGPASGATVVQGADGQYWVTFREQLMGDTSGTMSGLRVVRLSDPPAEETIVATEVYIAYRAFYIFQDPALGGHTEPVHKLLTIRAAGGPMPGDQFELPPGSGLFVPGGNDSVFLYWDKRADTTAFLIQQRNRSFSRMVPIPDGLLPDDPSKGTFFFNSDGKWLYLRDGTGRLRKISTLSMDEVDLGMRPDALALLEGPGLLFTCGKDGLVRVPVDGSAQTVLDDTACDGRRPIYFRPHSKILYTDQSGLFKRTALDGSTTPEVLLPAERHLILISSGDDFLYSLDDPDRYTAGASDGWLGDWRFMDRGRFVTYSRDNTTLRWLEHAARSGGIGDLTAAPAAGGPALRLALNVRQYEELGDGRLLVSSNRAFRGAQNRVITIDEQKREARWVADSAAEYSHIPGSTDLLVDVVTGPTAFDIVRVPVPPKP